ncbi:hypothetical protein J7T55_000871 [Diaporthe amygdali]|uniref:uncharacterized protein n=1 Tax=Phomopsis amygdali TaxID=1214568 RepID=UPI0022FE3420|nr:uncharacterized protein J7T55_000871 [Diaporthe amygdali]KAJ0120018.1 hypothetical protein J7T55_000871 [Diaporthe amygdali]
MASPSGQDQPQRDETPGQEIPSSTKRKRNSPPPRQRGDSIRSNANADSTQTQTHDREQITLAASSANDRESERPFASLGVTEYTANPSPQRIPSSSAPSDGQGHSQDAERDDSSVVATVATEFEDVIPPDITEKLVEVFYHTAYPLRPYFHWPTYRAQIHSRQHRSDWGLWTFTMAVCTMAAARLCDGVLIPTGLHPLRLQAATLFTTCYDAANKALPADIMTVPDPYHAMKAKALLASACLQNGDWRRAVAHLGDYASLSATTGFCQESNWPAYITEIQRQERRRVFWGAYQQEQYLASSFGLASRQREVKAMVKYPAEVSDDDDITETGVQLWADQVSFLTGWNFCSDLYRILERLQGTERARQQAMLGEPGYKTEAFLSELYSSKKLAAKSLHFVSESYENLPLALKKVKAMTGDVRKDRYGFIACNVLLTTQTLKMLLVGTEGPSVHMRCAIASELLDELSSIPMSLFHASSTLRHLAQIGHILGGGIQDTLPIWTFLQIRNILIVLADFLEEVESTRMTSPGLAVKLRAKIDRISDCIERVSQNAEETNPRSMARSLLVNWREASSNELVFIPDLSSMTFHMTGDNALNPSPHILRMQWIKDSPV